MEIETLMLIVFVALAMSISLNIYLLFPKDMTGKTTNDEVSEGQTYIGGIKLQNSSMTKSNK